MAIIVKCPVCEKSLSAPESAAGKRAKCPKCTAVVTIPTPQPPLFDEADYALTPAPEPSAQPKASVPSTFAPPNVASSRNHASGKAKSNPVAAPAERPQVPWRLALLLLALVPLALYSLAEKPDLEQRLTQALEASGELELDDVASLSDLLKRLPEGRIEGAHLSAHSWVHWLYALVSATAFFGLTFVLFDVGRTQVRHLFVSALTTATVGILLLLAFQWIAAATQGFNLVRGNVVILVLFWIVKFIGFSYRAAEDPSIGFGLSFLGFTFGVGLCEELVKAVPVLFRVQNENDGDDWRTASMWGFASGIGFGAAEGIMYSSDYYNGLMDWKIYVVRFVSCVALHAVWSAAVGLAIWRNRASFEHGVSYIEWGLFVLRVVAVSMVLHGLYDTLLKSDESGYALSVGALSFGWLFVSLEFTRRFAMSDEE